MDEIVTLTAMVVVLVAAVWMIDWAGRVTLGQVRAGTVANELSAETARHIVADNTSGTASDAETAAQAHVETFARARTAGICAPPAAGASMVDVDLNYRRPYRGRSQVTVTLNCGLEGSRLFAQSVTVSRTVSVRIYGKGSGW